MKLSAVNEMLDSNPHSFEQGWARLDDGVGFVAVRTDMPDCSGKMIDWWFSYLATTEQYKMWHPEDHVYCKWIGERGTGRYIGGTHIVHERLGGAKVHKLKINFREPSTILDVSRFEEAGVSTAVYARGGAANLPIWSGHVLHMVHDTDEGCVMRSRFWLGDVSPVIPVLSGLIKKDMTSDDALSSMERHCHQEMTILATFLPELYAEQH
ncbi:MAG: hypothetical protein COB84_01350 [Rhodobacteraceae bacterium]|nr:MAG: hypothetical protein COB84_01350 [Paracoccaceae bacterium]